MLASWIEIMPLFVVRWLARRYGEQITQGGELYYSARPDCYFTDATQAQIKGK